MATRNGKAEEPAIGRVTWDLAENAAVRLPTGGFARVVRVERGTVLVTQEDDLEDHVLEAGDELALRRRGLAVAWALTEASVSAVLVDGREVRGRRDAARRHGPSRHGAPGEAPSHVGA